MLIGAALGLVGAALGVQGSIVLALICFILAVAVFFSGASKFSLSARDWNDLAADFRRIDAHIRADWASETIGTGESWRFREDKSRTAEALCTLAGAMLLKSPAIAPLLSERVKSRSTDSWRWLYYIKEKHPLTQQISGTESSYLTKMQTEAGTIERLGEISASICVECAAAEIKKK